MKKPIALAILLLMGSSTVPLRAMDFDNTDFNQRQKVIEEHYARAIQYFNDGSYANAIQHWDEILKLDPEQTAASRLIKEARSKLTDQIGPLEETIRSLIKEGRYETALEKIQTLLERDSKNKSFLATKTRLENISAIRPVETGNSKSSVLVRKSLSAHLSIEEDQKMAVNAMRAARDFNPQHPNIDRLITYIEQQYPDTAKKELVTPGMSVVENKLFIALNQIYEGRFDLAIFSCNEVLSLDPTNVLALKRKGSAYFALNQKDKARENWEQALKLAPEDTEIKKFLSAK
ncbi:MAG TPA: tetratricopeptide repeat protein [Elusimicrobiota bacterium]|nr:tetratricopeptide repeat protein [Elusimicrobiota bacterium]